MCIRDSLNAKVFENVEECFTEVAKRNCTVIRITFRNQHMAVKAAHLRNTENTNAAKGTGSNRQDFTLCDISLKLSICGALKAEEGDRARSNVTLKGAAADVRLAVRLEQAVLDELVLKRLSLIHI